MGAEVTLSLFITGSLCAEKGQFSDTVRGFYLLLKEKTTDAKQIERENSAVRGR